MNVNEVFYVVNAIIVYVFNTLIDMVVLFFYILGEGLNLPDPSRRGLVSARNLDKQKPCATT